LRMTAGWPFQRFQEVTGFDLRDGWAREMEELVQAGLATKDDERFQLTPKGLRFADMAAEKFVQVE
jgi:coproporphyrinogen III oxidase-like Fe-S oxidoreductase